METRWLYVTSEELPRLREAACDTCIIPIGCVEKHGLHLPLGTDILQISRLAYLASQLETVAVFPDFTFGDMPSNAPTVPAGTITLPMEMEMALLEQLCRQIARNGFKKIIIYNGHGGNQSWLAAFLRRMENRRHDDFVVMTLYIRCSVTQRLLEKRAKDGAESLPELTEEDWRILEGFDRPGTVDGHAGVSETAYLMGITPESVRLDRLGIESGCSRNLTQKYKDVGIQIRDGGWDIEYPNAYEATDPVGINERIGRAALQLEAERAAKAFRLIKEDEDLLRWHHEFWNVDR